MRAPIVMGLLLVAGCGGDSTPDGYARWSGSGATFVHPEEWQESERSAEMTEGGLRYIAFSADESARVMVVEDEGRSLEGFMAESFTWGFPEVDVGLGPRERTEVPGAAEAVRREATWDGGVANLVFASHDSEHHLVLAVVTTDDAGSDVDEAAILDSFALE